MLTPHIIWGVLTGSFRPVNNRCKQAWSAAGADRGWLPHPDMIFVFCCVTAAINCMLCPLIKRQQEFFKTALWLNKRWNKQWNTRQNNVGPWEIFAVDSNASGVFPVTDQCVTAPNHLKLGPQDHMTGRQEDVNFSFNKKWKPLKSDFGPCH